MFGNDLFRSWPAVLAGAGCFGLFYGMIILMSDRLLFDIAGVSHAVLGVGLLSFAGYIGVAMLIRTRDDG